MTLIEESRLKIREALTPHLNPSYALCDFPDHDNVGDSAIWLGELVFLEGATGRRPDRTLLLSVDDLNGFEGTIFLHGGGNFGDVWPRFQLFRERVIQRFQNNKIVILPQTIHFHDPEALKASRAAMRHPDLTICVRDHGSLAIARTFECNAMLVPDMAFMLDLKSHPGRKGKGLFLHRTDRELTDGDRCPPDYVEDDWSADPPGLDRKAKLRAAFKAALSPKHARHENFRARANDRVRRGVALLDGYETILTDRLHGHILSTLLGKPHRVMNNSYGKNYNYMDTWRTDREDAPGRKAPR